MTDQAPIDIRYIELLIWLESRYLIPKDWAKRLELIENKKNEFLDEFFSKQTTEMKKLQETFKNFKANSDLLSYYELIRMNTMLLKTEEAKSKTLFGNFNSSLLKNSNLLLGVYNKNNLHLSESSKMILQCIGYDIPNLDKNTQYNEKNISDYEAKITEKNQHIERNLIKIKEMFKKYDIQETDKSKDIAIALVNRLNISLEKYLGQVENLSMKKGISESIRIYEHFYKKIYNEEIKSENFLKVLKRINNEGDYIDDISSSSGVSNKYKIIQMKIDEFKLKYENIDIQVDIDAQIWNFKLVEGEIKNETRMTALLTPKIRKQFINDLNEVLIFLNHRLNQSNNKDEINLSIYQNNLRNFNLDISHDLMIGCKNSICNLLELLNSPDLLFLFSLFDDEKTLKLIINKFELMKNENEKFRKNIASMNDKIEDIKKEINETHKKLVQVKKEVKLVKKQMEKYLTDSLKRKVTIIGDINLI